MKIFNSHKLMHKQKGATLFTALVFLTLMTIVSVSATKLSILDLLMAGNNQQKMELYQETSNDLKRHTDPSRLLPILQQDGVGVPWVEVMPTSTAHPNREEKIANRVLKYSCAGNGLATSIGPDVPPCYLFDFEVKNKKSNSSAKEKHRRGAGKEFPKANRNNYNN